MLLYCVLRTVHTCCCQWCRRKDVQSRPRQPWCPAPWPRPTPPSSWRGPRCCRTAPPPSPRSPCGPPGGTGCPCTAKRTTLCKDDFKSRRWLRSKSVEYKMSVPSSELGPPTPSPTSECVSPLVPKGGEEQHSLAVAGEGRGEQFGRLERMSGTLYTVLCVQLKAKWTKVQVLFWPLSTPAD